MRRFPLLSIILSALLLAGCGAEGIGGVTLVTAGAHTIGPGDRVAGELVIMGGETVVREGGQVAGSVYVLDGVIDISGDIRGGVSMIGGQVVLGPRANVHGDLDIGGGNLARQPGAVIRGSEHRATGITVPAQPLPAFRTKVLSAGWALGYALLLGALAAVATQVLPRPVARMARTATGYPLVCAALGLLGGIVIPALLVFMAFTVVLLPVVVLGALVLLAALVYGWLGLGAAAGQWMLGVLNKRLRPARAAFLGTVILTAAINLVSLVPLIGELIALLVFMVALGTALLTRFGSRAYVPPPETVWQEAWPLSDVERSSAST